MTTGALLWFVTDIRVNGVPCRKYVLDCPHAHTQLEIPHPSDDAFEQAAADMIVLGNLVPEHRAEVAADRRIRGGCHCQLQEQGEPAKARVVDDDVDEGRDPQA